MRLLKLFVVHLLLLCYGVTYAQHAAFENLAPLSPTTAEFQKYGEYPVGHYTGVPNISIPLYTIKSGDIEVPITLSYHASGIRVDQEATWVGLGWTLNAGGNISTQVRGKDDYKGHDNRVLSDNKKESYHFREPIIKLTADNKKNKNFTPEQVEQYILKSGFVRRDMHPDLYFYNFSGYSGQFILNDFPRGISTKREEGLVFTSTDGRTPNPNEEKAFMKVESLNGNKYYFNFGERVDNYSMNPVQPGSVSISSRVSAWHLTTIKSKTGKEINFEYFRDKNALITSIPQTNVSSIIPYGHVVTDKNGKIVKQPLGIDCSDGRDYLGFKQIHEDPYCGKLGYNFFTEAGEQSIKSSSSIQPIYLKRIDFEQGYILLKTSVRNDLYAERGEARKLSFLEIYNNNDELLKGYQFLYNYVNDINTPLGYSKKLSLHTLREYYLNNTDTVYKNPYTFEYYKNKSKAYRKDSENFDAWGYPNSGIDPLLKKNIFVDDHLLFYGSSSSTQITKDTFLDLHNLSSTTSDPERAKEEEFSRYRKLDLEEYKHEVDTIANKLYTLTKINYPTKGSTVFNFETNTYRNRYTDNYFSRFFLDKNELYDYYYFNNLFLCPKEPCSTLKKIKYRKKDGAGVFAMYNPTASKEDADAGFDPYPYAKDSFTIKKRALVFLRYNFAADNLLQPFNIKGTLKRSNGTPVLSFRYNFVYGPYTEGNTYVQDYYENGKRIQRYTPSKSVYLDPGEYTLELENLYDTPSFNILSLYADVTEVYQEDFSEQLGGGLRIKSIENYDADDKLIEKTNYDYTGIYEIQGTGGNGTARMSSGKLLAPVKYNYEHSHTWSDEFLNEKAKFIPGIYTHQSVEKIFSSPRPLTPMGSSAHGQSIGYDRVSVAKTNAVNETIGKEIYEFKNELETLASNPTNSPNNKHLDNGQLINKKVYNTDDVVVYKQENAYSKEDDDIYMYGISTRWASKNMNNFKGTNSAGFEPQSIKTLHHFAKFTDYKIRSEWWHMDQRKEIFYDLNGENPVVKTTSYEYNNNKSYQPTKITVNTSEGDSAETVVHYPDDIANETALAGGPLTLAEFNAIKRLQYAGADYQPATPIQTETTENGSTTIERTSFGIFNLTDQISTALPKSISTATDSNTLEKQVEYLSYDAHGNPQEIERANGIHVVYIWGYKGEYLVAKIENATYQSITANSNLSSLVNDIVSLSNDDTNVIAENLLKTKLEALQDHASLSKAMISTYTHDPLIGVTSMTDPKGYTMTYHYDAQNRLEYVKDATGNLVSKNKYNYKNN